ncbi:MAG: co-chaperone GroES [Salinispira sp.]
MNIQPLSDRVLLKPDTGEEKTSGGLFIPQTAQEKTQTASVVAIGDDTETITVKVGDRVMHDKYAGTQVKIDGEDHLIVNFSDVIAVIK